MNQSIARPEIVEPRSSSQMWNSLGATPPQSHVRPMTATAAATATVQTIAAQPSALTHLGMIEL